MRTSRYGAGAPQTAYLPEVEDIDVWLEHRGRERESRRMRRRRAPTLSGVVRLVHLGRSYGARYELHGDLLTVYCGLAANTGLLPTGSPSPKPLAERLLRELIDAEHPGLNPA